jgi:hypothetical protein
MPEYWKIHDQLKADAVACFQKAIKDCQEGINGPLTVLNPIEYFAYYLKEENTKLKADIERLKNEKESKETDENYH